MASAPGYDEKLWKRFRSLGLTALAAPEVCDASFLDTRVVLSKLGRFLTPGPFLGAVVAAAAVTSTGADVAGLLPAIADGSVIPSLV